MSYLCHGESTHILKFHSIRFPCDKYKNSNIGLFNSGKNSLLFSPNNFYCIDLCDPKNQHIYVSVSEAIESAMNITNRTDEFRAKYFLHGSLGQCTAVTVAAVSFHHLYERDNEPN